MQQLANLSGLPESRHAVGPILTLLSKTASASTQLVACTALSVLAETGDQAVLDGLEAVRVASVGEVAWSAALAEARLGSPAGKSTLVDLLDRTFWEAEGRYQKVDDSGQVLRYRMPPARVDECLLAAVHAVACLDEEDLWALIEGLADQDPSARVRSEAAKALRDRSP
jgi:HEAT repeat protein